MESLAHFLNLPAVGPTQSENEGDDPYSGCTSMKEFAERVLNSQEYRQSLYRRVLADELPAQIEQLLYYYAAGKPTERFEHSGRDGGPIETVTEVRRVIVPVTENYDADDEVTRH